MRFSCVMKSSKTTKKLDEFNNLLTLRKKKTKFDRLDI